MRPNTFALTLALIWLCAPAVRAEDPASMLPNFPASADVDHDSPASQSVGGQQGQAVPPISVSRPHGSYGARERVMPGGAVDGCPVNPQRLTDFANGVSYDFRSVVTYLTAPECIASGQSIATRAAHGVDFNSTAPYRLDNYALDLPKNDLESSKRLDASLTQTIPYLLRENPLGSSELLPIIGQLTILSPGAAKEALATLIERELYAGDRDLSGASKGTRDLVTADLVKTLNKLGASEGPIATNLASAIEDQAILAEADRLGKIIRSLAAAASADAKLVPTFNLSASALNRGVQRGKNLYRREDRYAMLASVFRGIQAVTAGSAALEPGASELNDAFAALLGGAPLTATRLRTLWNEAVRMLILSSNQSALADAVAASLTPEMIFISPRRMASLMAAARNYPQISASIQNNFLLAWNRLWDNVQDGKIRLETYNRMRERYFKPLVAEILNLDPYLIDPYWLREVQHRGMISDDVIEKKFPRFVLAYLDRRDKATGLAISEPGLEPTLAAMTENFAVLWTLGNVYVPPLVKWVKKNEQ